jgi:asparagine synthase (glutamine-hydrolysing)
MCGIAGFFSKNQSLGFSTLEDMTNVLHRRGPDDSGFELYKKNSINVGLGHKRLSILDLSKCGHQPMTYESLSVVFNGEIYNFQEIKQELLSFGYKFDSDSDTEVIIKSFHKWGKECVDKFRGMWAFVIYDKNKNNLTLCRDRVGIKPLYYYASDDVFLFSSELKSFYQVKEFQKIEDRQSLYYYFKYGYIPTPYTIFEKTYKLEPGSFMTIDDNFHIKKELYWEPESSIDERSESYNVNLSEESLVDKLDIILKESFSLRMVSDVPIGVFLSGGVDSSLVTAILQENSDDKINTFTIGFNDKSTNEAIYAKKVAEYIGTNHRELYINPKQVLEAVKDIPKMFDEPFGDHSSIPTYIVSKFASQYVKVVLSADGGDELFGGYENYQKVLKLHSILKRIPKSIRKVLFLLMSNNIFENISSLIPLVGTQKNFSDKYKKLVNSLLSNDVLEIFDESKSYWTNYDLESLLISKTKDKSIYSVNTNTKDLANSLMLHDLKTYMLDDILTKVDRSTMYASIEGREPMLDNKIVEFSLNLPSCWKIRNGENKFLLKRVLYRYLPKKLIDRPKKGFSMPMDKWFRGELRPLLDRYLSRESLLEANIFNVDFILDELERFYEGKNTNPNKFWLVLMYMMWREEWL